MICEFEHCDQPATTVVNDFRDQVQCCERCSAIWRRDHDALAALNAPTGAVEKGEAK